MADPAVMPLSNCTQGPAVLGLSKVIVTFVPTWTHKKLSTL